MKNTSSYSDAPKLTDAMVASLEAFLPGGSEAKDTDKSAALELQIKNALVRLEEDLLADRKKLHPPTEYEALAAASHAVQSALLSLQLLEAGRTPSRLP